MVGLSPQTVVEARTSSEALATNPNPQAGNGVDSLFVVGQGLNLTSQTNHPVMWTVVVQWVPTFLAKPFAGR